MKLSLLSATLLFNFTLSQNVNAATSKRLFDGYNAVCEQKADLGKLAQRISISADNRNKDSNQLALDIQFLKCVQIDSDFALLQRALSDEQASGIKISEPELLLVLDETELILTRKLDVELSRQSVLVELPATSSPHTIDAFIRILVDMDGKSYDTFGPFRIQK